MPSGILFKYHRLALRHGFYTVILCVAIFLCASADLRQLSQDSISAEPDAFRFLLMKNDCVYNNTCALRGDPQTNPLSVGVFQGAILNHLLALVGTLGGGEIDVLYTIRLLWALAIMLLFLMGKKIFGYSGGIAAAVILYFLWRHVYSMELTTLWPSRILPLYAVLYLFAASCYIKTLKLRYLLLTAFALSIGGQAHPTFGAAGLSMFYLIALSPRGERLLGFFLSMGTILLFFHLLSPGMFIRTDLKLGVLLQPSTGNAHQGQFNWLTLLLISWGILVAVLLKLAKDADVYKKRVSLFILVGYWPFLILAFASNLHAIRYYFGLLPGMALMVPLTLHLGKSVLLQKLKAPGGKAFLKSTNWIMPLLGYMGAAILLVYMAKSSISIISIKKMRGPQENRYAMTLNDARAMVDFLAGRTKHRSFGEIYRHMKGGKDNLQLLRGAALYTPPNSKQGVSKEKLKDFAVLKIISSKGGRSLPGNWQKIRNLAGMELIVKQYAPLLDWRVFWVALIPEKAKTITRWSKVEYSKCCSFNSPYWLSRMALEMDTGLPPSEGNFSILLAVPIKVPANARPRILKPLDLRTPQTWLRASVLALNGIAHREKLPSPMITVEAGKKETSGLAFFVFGPSNKSWFGKYNIEFPPPVVLELTPQDRAFLKIANPGLFEHNINHGNRGDPGAKPIINPTVLKNLKGMTAGMLARMPRGSVATAKLNPAKGGQEPTAPRWLTTTIFIIVILITLLGIFLCSRAPTYRA